MDIIRERHDLAVCRIRELVKESSLPENYASYVKRTGEFILMMEDIRGKLEDGWYEAHPEQWPAMNRAMYEDILPENYAESFANPAYAVSMLGEDMGKLLCFLNAQIRGLIAYIFEGKREIAVAHAELFVQVVCILMDYLGDRVPKTSESEKSECRAQVRDALYWFESDNTDLLAKERILDHIDPSHNFAVRIAEESNLSDLTYLYRYGEYITENEIETARHLNSLPQEEISRLADTWSQGYRMGFVLAGKPLEKKSTAAFIYHVGFERIVRAAMENLRKTGLRPTAYRYAVSAVSRRSAGRNGFTGAVANPQYDYDHREDFALFLDPKFVEREIEVSRKTYEDNEELAAGMAGPVVMETFGEAPFEPVNKSEAWALRGHQQKLSVKLNSALARLTNRYIIGSERSFTIIAFPLPGIAAVRGTDGLPDGPGAIDADRYARIFNETCRLNVLESAHYHRIQQKLIDALDRGTHVRIRGKGSNHTDLTVQLYRLKDPAKETIFENCGADVNIPVGEVFTTPVLKGTDGVLHVSQVYLEGLNFRELEIRFRDGMITDYDCANFDSEEDNKRYIRENILFHHDTLPMGEFAIGTNTTAYAMGKNYKVAAQLPILIAEKTGPHFAVGDTCYSWEEDEITCNPDGKRIVARDNEISACRREDPEKAYFNCHTDITLPYEELGVIEVCGEDGYREELLKDGRFVLKGTEELNLPLETIRS